MNQFNQAAAENIANKRGNIHTTWEVVQAIKEYCNYQPIPTPEIIEFDLDKLKTGEWEIQHSTGRPATKYKWVEEFELMLVQWRGNKDGDYDSYNESMFTCLRLISKPVPTKKVWYVNSSKMFFDYVTALDYYNKNGGEIVCIEEPINQEKK